MSTPADELRDLRAENRRLRLILAGITSSGLGKGALIEVAEEGANGFTLVVCRADVDELAFAETMREALAALAAVLGGVLGEGTRRGVMAETTIAPAPEGWTGRKCPGCSGSGEGDDGTTCHDCGGTGDEYAAGGGA